jgi:hypothetical protein
MFLLDGDGTPALGVDATAPIELEGDGGGWSVVRCREAGEVVVGLSHRRGPPCPAAAALGCRGARSHGSGSSQAFC